jgi:predicted dehydrogenase
MTGIGIVGCAHGHVGMYCAEWRKHPEQDVSVVAAWDHNAQRLAAFGGAHGARTYEQLDELLAAPDVQAVVIGAETSLHADVVEKAAAAGKTIVLQKPIALTLPEADRIVRAVQRHGVPFTLAWQMRADPQNIKIKELVESGLLGKIIMVRRRHGLGVHTWPNYRDLWHINPKLNRDIWADDASHPIDFLHWLLGVPDTVTAEMETLLDPAMPMDNGIAVFRYANGPLAEVCCSFTCTAAENTTEVIGEKGSIVQNYGDVPSCNVPRPDGACGLKWYTTESKQWTCSDIASPATHAARIISLSAHLAEFLHGKRPPIATADEGRTSLRMVLACYVSTRQGRRVRMDDSAIAAV